jgi:hypothetical protein
MRTTTSEIGPSAPVGVEIRTLGPTDRERDLDVQIDQRAPRDEGITRLLAYVDGDNRLVLAWIARAGGVRVAHDGDAILYSIPLDRSAEERRAA